MGSSIARCAAAGLTLSLLLPIIAPSALAHHKARAGTQGTPPQPPFGITFAAPARQVHVGGTPNAPLEAGGNRRRERHLRDPDPQMSGGAMRRRNPMKTNTRGGTPENVGPPPSLASLRAAIFRMSHVNRDARREQ